MNAHQSPDPDGQQLPLPSPLLLGRGEDQLRRQHEPIVAQVPQLDRVRKLSATDTIDVVRGSARGGVEDGAAGSKGVGGTVGRRVADGLADHGGGLGPLAQLGGVEGLLVAEGGEDVLAVAVPVDEELDLGGVAEAADEAVEPLVLGGVGWCFAAVGLGARVCGGAARVGVPAELPVAVDVAAVAGWVGCVGGRGLSVLAPEAVGCLGVDEAWGDVSAIHLVTGGGGRLAVGVHEWEDPEVVFVQGGCDDGIILGVPVDELERDILDNLNIQSKRQRCAYRSGNPFASVDSAVVQNGWLPRTGIAIQMDTEDVASLLVKVGDVVRVVVVRGKPVLIVPDVEALREARRLALDGSAKVLVEDLVLEVEGLECRHLAGGDEDVDVVQTVVVPALVAGQAGVELATDIGWAAVRPDPVDLEAVIGDALDFLCGGSSEGGPCGEEGQQSGFEELHLRDLSEEWMGARAATNRLTGDTD
ncbi:unnamed protein product [Clonostachys byssicola]|uniref:Uncharacterized protein n=1 Tax=Clonostachys byssicola TaxID=160290 RepID=A0A9N9U6V0_9HYPO|nr:unnamed protein product [Clonostachys byssicola]